VTEKVEKDTSKFDWVTERSSCALPKVFKVLRLQVDEDLKTRNALRPDNSPYKFSMADNGGAFSALMEAKDEAKSAPFGRCDGWLLKSCCFEASRLGHTLRHRRQPSRKGPWLLSMNRRNGGDSYE
jgi:hypothetical protein